MELKDWKVYLIVGALGLAGMLYTCNKRVDVKSSVQLSDVRTSNEVLFTKQAHSIYTAGLERAGSISRNELSALVHVADSNKDNIIDDAEAKELFFLLAQNAPKEDNYVRESFDKQPTYWQKRFMRCPVLPDGGKPMSVSEYWRAQQKVYSWYSR